MAAQMDVYQGYWVDWARGPIVGAQLTLTNGKSTYLVALIAILVQFSGGSLWTMIAYGLFNRTRSATLKAILRNTSSPTSALERFLHIAWTLSRTPTGRKRVPIAIACLAAINAIGAIIAGVLSANVATTPSDVLVQSTSCGDWPGYGARDPYKATGRAKDSTLVIEDSIHKAWIAASLSRSRNHASICFNSTSLTCDPMGRRRVSVTTTVSPDCPFTSDICRGNQTVVIDTGMIDSTRDLGINTPKNERLGLSIQLQCTPLDADGYTTFYDKGNLSILTNGSEYLQQQLRLPSLDDSGLTAFAYGTTTHLPYSFVYNNLTSVPFVESYGPGPQVSAISLPNIPTLPLENNRTTLISSLRRPNTTTHLFFFVNEIVYAGPVDDPIFYAHNISTWTSHPDRPRNESETSNTTVWYAEKPVSVLGCSQRTKVCVANSESPHCTYLTSYGVKAASAAMKNVSHSLDLTSRQESVLVRILDALTVSDIGKVPIYLGESALLAKKYYSRNVSAPLPPDQWIQEVQGWVATSITNMQLTTTQFVTGLPDPTWNSYRKPPGPGAKWMCHSQVVHRNDYTSISVLGLVVVLSVSICLLGFECALPFIARRRAHRCRKKCKVNGEDEWANYDILKLVARQ